MKLKKFKGLAQGKEEQTAQVCDLQTRVEHLSGERDELALVAEESLKLLIHANKSLDEHAQQIRKLKAEMELLSGALDEKSHAASPPAQHDLAAQNTDLQARLEQVTKARDEQSLAAAGSLQKLIQATGSLDQQAEQISMLESQVAKLSRALDEKSRLAADLQTKCSALSGEQDSLHAAPQRTGHVK